MRFNSTPCSLTDAEEYGVLVFSVLLISETVLFLHVSFTKCFYSTKSGIEEWFLVWVAGDHQGYV